MKTIKNLTNTRSGQKALIICAGSSLRKYKKRIQKYIEHTQPFTVGINNMVDFFIPTYHLWTNTQRFRSFGGKIDLASIILLGSGIHLKTIKKVIGDREYILINYTGQLKKGIPIDYRNGKICGYFRTAGCLAIMIASLMGASEINIVGMDGYSKYKYEDLKSKKESQHCYGKGLTDTADWQTCIKKDEDITLNLNNIKKHGIAFKIITPTIYDNFYDGTIL